MTTDIERALTLPAGAELDEAIHQVVFGAPPCECLLCRTAAGFGRPRKHTAPRYSDSFSTAQLVIDAMSDRGYGLALGRDLNGSGWWCSFRDYITWTADTGPLAICRAALAAILSDHPTRHPAQETEADAQEEPASAPTSASVSRPVFEREDES